VAIKQLLVLKKNKQGQFSPSLILCLVDEDREKKRKSKEAKIRWLFNSLVLEKMKRKKYMYLKNNIY
jgi:hypothetical protein